MSKTDLARLTLLLSAIFMTVYPLFGISQQMATKMDTTLLGLFVCYCAVKENDNG